MNNAGTELMPKRAETNGLPVMGTAFSLNAAMLNDVSNIVMTTEPFGTTITGSRPMETDEPFGTTTTGGRPMETDDQPPSTAVDMDDEVEKETYEVLDVVENESDADENGGDEMETNKSDGRASQIAGNNDSGQLPKIKRVFQGVTDHLFHDITMKRKEKIRVTKMLNKMAKKSTSNINKSRVTAVSVHPNKRNQIQSTTYSRPTVASHSASERAKTFQSTGMKSGDGTKPSPPHPDDDLIELIEIPENMELDTALIAVENECNDSVDVDDNKSLIEKNDQHRDYRCNICLEQNKNFVQLKKHLFDTHQLTYVCRECHGTFDFRYEYDKHMKRGDCSEKLNTYRQYITVIDPPIRESEIVANVDKSEETLFCSYCSLKCFDLSEYCAHAQKHAKIFTCKICSRENFKSKVNMAIHLRIGTHHNEDYPRYRNVFDKNGLYMSTEVSVHTDYPNRRRNTHMRKE